MIGVTLLYFFTLGKFVNLVIRFTIITISFSFSKK